MKVKIILEVEADDLDWGGSTAEPIEGNTDGYLAGHYDIDLVGCQYDGQPVEFVNADEAADYLIFLHGESDIKEYAHA